MINLFLLITLTIAQKSNRVIQPDTKIIRELVYDADYIAHLNQSIMFQYTNYFGAFDVQLTQTQFGKNVIISEADSFNPDIIQGCRPYGRKIVQKQLFNKTLFLPNENESNVKGIITSVYAANQFVFILRNDYQLIIMEIQYNSQEKSINSFEQFTVVNVSEVLERKDENQYMNDGELQCSQYLKEGATVTCYILSKEAIGVFQFNQYEKSMKSITKLDLFRDELVVDTFLDDNNRILLVTFETFGVYVYNIVPDGTLNLLEILKPHTDLKLKQAKISEYGEYIYILDEYIGIIIYNFNVIEKKITLNDIYINIQGGQSFDFFLNTIFLVARTEDDLPYALEIFFDQVQNQYYFNQIYQYGQDIYDVFVGYTFAMFVGNELHQVIHHSVYNKFQENQEQFYFSDIDLVQVDQLYPPWKYLMKQSQAFSDGIFKDVDMEYGQTFLVGVSEKEVSLIELRSIPPWIFCSALEEIKEFYQLTIRSTNCITKSNSELDQFKECEIKANFTFSGQPIYFFEEDHTLFMAIVITLIALIIILSILLLLCRKKWYIKLDELDEKQLEEYSKRELNKIDTEQLQTVF